MKKKKKSSILYKLFKTVLIILSIPIFLLWLLIIALYIPPVQRYVVDTLCEEASSGTGFNVEIGTFHLSFPLTLNVTDFKVSRNDTLFAAGEQANVSISLLPLFQGEVEVNYVALEKISLDTHELIDGIKASGEIGYFRTVARNIKLEEEIADLRQIHLHSASLNVELGDMPQEEEEESAPLNWIVRLRRGNIENSRFNLSIPGDTLQAGGGIGKLRIDNAVIDLGMAVYSVRNFAISNSNVKYDKGFSSRDEAPLDHIAINDINIGCRNIHYSGDSTKVHLYKFNFVQPQGIRITNAEAELAADTTILNIKSASLKSKNGSYISLATKLPWSAIKEGGVQKLKAYLRLGVNKKDLGALLTKEEMNSLALLQENMLSAEMRVNGNMSYLEIDTMGIDIPGIANLQASGHAGKLYDMKQLEALIELNGNTGSLRRMLGTDLISDSITTDIATIDGTIAYNSGEANADLDITCNGGKIAATASYGMESNSYNADISVAGLDIAGIMPSIPLQTITLKLKAEGEGIDLFSGDTRYNVELGIDTVSYDKYKLNDIALTASQENHLSDIEIKSNAEYLKFLIKARTTLDSTFVSNSTEIELPKADFMMLRLTDAELGAALNLKLEASTDMKEKHAVKLSGREMKLITAQRTFTPADIEIDLSTSPQYSYIKASNGDLNIDGEMACGYNGLFAALEKAGQMYMEARHCDSTLYYLHDYEKEFPEMKFKFKCGQNNMLHNLLAMNDMQTQNMSLTLQLDTIKGVNMSGGVYGFRTGTLNLDTIRAFTRQDGNKIRYLASIRSTAIDPEQQKQTFNAMLYGNIFNDSLTTNFMFRDKKEGVGIKFGFKTQLMPEGLHINFLPDAILLGNRFKFSDDNHINIGKGFSVDANVMLSDSDNAGMHIYTNPDPAANYNANLDLFNVDLGEITSLLPFVPEIDGTLNMNLFFRQSSENMLISGDAQIDSVAYEGTYIGNETLEVLYFPKDKETHYLDVILSHEEEEIAHMSGDYVNDVKDPGLHGNISLIRFPLAMTKAFTKDAGMNIEGYVNSNLSATGKFSKLRTDGFVQFDSVYINAPLLGTDLHLADEEVKIEENEIKFNNFNIYAKGKNPFKVNGTIDMSRLANPAFNLRMTASNYELINAPRKRGAMLYGRMFVDFRSFIGGTLNDMKIYGNATLLGKSDITYVMLDAPIESDKELDGLVEFVNFNDSTAVETSDEELDFGNTNFNFSLKIEDGARINADFDENRNSYITLRGGGNLNVTYTGETGMNVIGTYTMNEGEMKYELPIIPLKTFSIVDGSKVSWTGDIFNPDINITALERITTSVSIDDNMMPVAFDVGVKLSNTLSNMGLSFTISAPENAAVQDHLNTLDEETLNKYAVTMLITGTYIGNTKGMTVSNALSTFIDSKINDLAGSAMKSVSVNVGINDAQNAETGSTYKNYSFSFKKRFWNDRITIVIGGEVNTGDHPTGSESFINNVSLEWKISNSSTRYVRLFYDKNYESLLEGEIIETGVGYIYKRKFNNLSELLIFKKKENTPATIPGGQRSNTSKKKEEEK